MVEFSICTSSALFGFGLGICIFGIMSEIRKRKARDESKIIDGGEFLSKQCEALVKVKNSLIQDIEILKSELNKQKIGKNLELEKQQMGKILELEKQLGALSNASSTKEESNVDTWLEILKKTIRDKNIDLGGNKKILVIYLNQKSELQVACVCLKRVVYYGFEKVLAHLPSKIIDFSIHDDVPLFLKGNIENFRKGWIECSEEGIPHEEYLKYIRVLSKFDKDIITDEQRKQLEFILQYSLYETYPKSHFLEPRYPASRGYYNPSYF